MQYFLRSAATTDEPDVSHNRIDNECGKTDAGDYFTDNKHGVNMPESHPVDE